MSNSIPGGGSGEVPGARPEVEGLEPMSMPYERETSTDRYAAGWPTARKTAWSATASVARRKQKPGLPETTVSPIEVASFDDLKKVLLESGVSIEEWGEGSAKTVNHLFDEIIEGETILIREGEELIRKVAVARATVVHTLPSGEKLSLVERRQVFSDGRTRERPREHAVAEKMKYGENPDEAMLRGICEELGLCDEIDITKTLISRERDESLSYPGVTTEWSQHNYHVELNSNQFHPEGYIEVQDGLTTYFEWDRII